MKDGREGDEGRGREGDGLMLCLRVWERDADDGGGDEGVDAGDGMGEEGVGKEGVGLMQCLRSCGDDSDAGGE